MLSQDESSLFSERNGPAFESRGLAGFQPGAIVTDIMVSEVDSGETVRCLSLEGRGGASEGLRMTRGGHLFNMSNNQHYSAEEGAPGAPAFAWWSDEGGVPGAIGVEGDDIVAHPTVLILQDGQALISPISPANGHILSVDTHTGRVNWPVTPGRLSQALGEPAVAAFRRRLALFDGEDVYW